MAVMDNPQLDSFRREVARNLAYGVLADEELPVTGDDGGHPVVVALEDERLSVVLGRLRAVGGSANLFVRGRDRVRLVSVIAERCAIGDADDDMSGIESPGPSATVGMFLEYLTHHRNGVMLSAEAIGHAGCARDARDIPEFAKTN